ncbi:MAG: methionine adenosyltransferase [Spirochaetales bacterium]|nr:methionine adenosyltransferase [Candidatus Physcosoma equi]
MGEKRMKSFFTSESITKGHPDKVADQISDAILDAILAQDPYSRCAAETTVEQGRAHVMGEVTTKAKVDYIQVIRDTIASIGYTDDSLGFSDKSEITCSIHEQSPDIAMGVDALGAGDQGMMFGYASNETEELMPLALTLARRLTDALVEKRESGELTYLKPDGKSQVTVEYDDGKPTRIDAVVLSTQHSAEISTEDLRKDIKENLILKTLPKDMIDENTKFFINPTGRFVIGGPAGDTGLTGRKIIADTYGGYAHHGGGAFSGKDSTKVDRSAAYAARNIAKTIVASGAAETAEVQLAYAIGVKEPVSIHVDTFGTGKTDEETLVTWIRENYDLSPKGIIDRFGLRQPVFLKTASAGHFGNPEFSWEKLDKTTMENLKKVL